MWVKVGAVLEGVDNSGVSHFLEHMVFKGTEKYSAEQINQEIENLGGWQNAATSMDYTNYYLTVPPSAWETGLQVVQQLTLYPRLPADQFDLEKQVIISELKRDRDNPERIIWKKFNPLIYPDHPYGKAIIGTRQTLDQLEYNQLVDFHSTYYRPENLVLIVAGKFSVVDLLKRVEQLFLSSSTPAPGAGSRTVPEVPLLTGSRELQGNHPVGQVYGLYGTVGYGIDHPESVQLDLLVKILGGSRSSRLYEQLVYRKQLADSIVADFITRKEAGPLLISYRCSPENLDKLEAAIDSTMKQIVEEGIGEEELKRARVQLETELIYSSQTAAGQTDQLGYGLVLDNLDYIINYIAQLRQVSRADLTALAEEMFIGRKWARYRLLSGGESDGEN